MKRTRKRVAVLVGHPDEEFQRGFLKGFAGRAAELNMDTYVFCMRLEYQNNKERETGDAAIFQVINFALFDAVLVLADTIQATGVLEKLENLIRDKFHGPVLFVDGESPFFPVIWTDCYHPMQVLVSHLIEKCGYQRIAFLSGKEWNRHAKVRLQAFRDTMQAHGLEVEEKLILEGDFWYTSGMRCAKILLDRNETLPEAVVCANDVMAIGFCEEMVKNGIRIPEDLAVAGCDSEKEGRISPKALTSVFLDSEGSGAHAVNQLSEMMNGAKTEPESPVDENPKLFYGETCRFLSGEQPPSNPYERRDRWGTSESRMTYLAAHSSSDNDLMQPDNLDDLVQMIWGHIAHVEEVAAYHVVLDCNWNALDTEMLNTRGISETMICVMAYEEGETPGKLGERGQRFPLKDMLPANRKEIDQPVTCYFAPLFFEDRFFGYTVASFLPGAGGYDQEYRLYLGALSRGFEVLRRTQLITEKTFGMEIMPFAAPEAQQKTPLDKRELSREERKEYREAMKVLDQNLFRYFFQPIVSAETGDIYSYEALMRADSALSISPLDMIRYAQMDGRLHDIERNTLRNVLNIINREEVFREKKVFINSIPGVMLADDEREEIEGLLRMRADNVVIEITEQSELDDEHLEQLKERYRSLGTRIAIDDYGMGYSNAGNLLRYMPDIVKIDRALLSNIEKSKQKQSFVRQIIEFCHDNGMMALAEGVETAEEMRTVIRFGVDLIQGYYTARPSADPIESISENVKSEIRRYQQERQDGSDQTVYVAGKTGHVLMGNLIKDGINHILLGADRMIYRDITFTGAPGQRSGIHLEIAHGYEGVITLEDVSFYNIKNRPCIDIGPGSNVVLVLNGSNVLTGNGVRVAPSSRLRIEGNGNLEIRANADGYYGIGAGPDESHGTITFSQDGEIRVNANGIRGICIGAGEGGTVEIDRGRFTLIQSGQEGVAIGTFEADSEIKIRDCEISIDQTETNGVCIGSLNGNSDVSVERSALRIYSAAKRFAAIGTLGGESAVFTLKDGHVDADVQMDEGTAIGSITGSSRINVFRAGLALEGRGYRAVLLGGYSENTQLSFDMANIRCDVRSEERKITAARRDNVRITESRCRFLVNGIQVRPPASEDDNT